TVTRDPKVMELQNKWQELQTAKNQATNKSAISNIEKAQKKVEESVSKRVAEIQQGGFIKNPLVDDVADDVVKPGQKERGFTTSVKDSKNILPEVKAKVSGEYTPITNKDTITKAQQFIDADPQKALADFFEQSSR